MDPAILKGSIEKMNKAAASREDTEFGKQLKVPQADFLKPQHRFTLPNQGHAHLGTLGGVRVSGKTEALTAKGDVIPGLYAVGTDAGGMAVTATTCCSVAERRVLL